MASRNVIVALVVIFAVALPNLIRATEYVVGDDQGWTPGFNYTAWAHGKEFRVGDKLVFKYAAGDHNVYKVTAPQFLGCEVPSGSGSLTSGDDIITLATPGKKWYICGVGDHCELGQKLVINVLPAAAQPPSWSPLSSPAWEAPAPSPSVSITGPTQYIVGDETGWTINFNYTVWAQDKTFRVGDSIVFKYHVGYHNVFKVSGPDFRACKVPPAEEALTTGNDVITLATPGRKWYICGFGNGAHCQAGQRLFITVLPAEWQAPSPSPSASYAMHYHSPSPAMSWESPSPSAGMDAPSPAPSEGATPSSPYFFFNRFLKY